MFNLNKNRLAIATTVVVMMFIFFSWRQFGETVKVGDVYLFAFFAAAILVLPVAAQCDEILRRLRSLEPKTGSVAYSYAGDGAGAASKGSARDELTHSLAITLAPHLATRMTDRKVGAYIRGVVDEILGAGIGRTADAIEEAKAGMAIWSQLTASAYEAMSAGAKTPGEKADQLAEAEIVGQGLTAPRVTAEQIQALMNQLTWRYEQPEGTTSTFAHAFLGRFYLATGHSACVSPENFDAALGMKYAREQAEGKAREKLWELEGYKLAQPMLV